ncbi:hypothetical protein BJY52DRAFT_1261983 [Lactarius psammicola]|nr:hypothetical protein BJY52DRAFT_1261983 [Lactarius psammicola]
MSSLPTTPPYTCWASADKWRAGFVILGANVNAILTPPPQSTVIIGVDGLWGAHEWTVYPQPYCPEFPYLAWIPLRPSNSSTPFDVLTCPVDKSMWQARPDISNIHVTNPDLLDKLTVKWKSLKAALQDPFKDVSSHPGSSIQRPMKAYTRAFEALSRLEQDFGTWRDFVEVFRNLQRSLLELHAFLDWWKDIRAGDDFRPPIRAPTRGAIFEDARLYANYARWSVRAFLLVNKSTFVLDPSKEPLQHSLHHWYYPPFVHDFVTELETVARGYAERLDIFNPTKNLKRRLEKKENKMSDEAGRRAKKVKADTASLLTQKELRRFADAGAAPDWFPRIQEVWSHAVNHVSHFDLASQESCRRFALPPIHLFWGGDPPNQRIYYYHYLVLFNEIRNRLERDLPGLTTQEWRSILGNTYWKKQWPKPNGSNPSLAAFDPNVFWKYGGTLLFGDERSADVIAGRYIPTSQLSCRCDVQLATADDTDIRQVVLYYLNSFHMYEEIREMERHQFPTTFEKRWKDQKLLVNEVVEMWNPSGGGVNPDFFCDEKVWRSWIQAVRGVVADWNGFEYWDWGSFSEVRTMGIDELSAPDCHKFTVRLLAFFIHSFVTRLGYYPSSLLRPPTLAACSCTDHAKKFGKAHTALPFPSGRQLSG